MSGLREQKKAQTRQHITDTATLLFRERGFDAVTVAEVAREAGVSTMTVFNHFPRKEDLLLDRVPETVHLVTGAVADRADGETPLAALRRLLLELVDQRHPLGAIGDSFVWLWRVVLDSPSLRARAREALEEVEDALTGALAEAGERRPRLTAALVVAGCRVVYAQAAGRQLAGERAADVVVEHRAAVAELFDALEGVRAGLR
ncbi:TetR/AcrR family transcriptional regulator [Streptomyces sp. VRA16 Mangrove soil]|uniref:TetR/AcrR family transcriptional regulator n=1 Tax=Streptomyces sp. VRA16 Mangrove soil TaxID=2817434 RepID=UPI001AA005CB|nr:TetR/AcrR family transcriptional regulator [Streptomyces sp. VRA16 Mangrove soil]MBO1334845.1 TetR/AcrR family transcriptional regulator [Streptomyces sp. VRA16 Mangrove soil]